MTLTDEAALIRGLSITLVGRLSLLNPAYVMPALRKHLMQLLSDLEHASDHAQKEGFRPPWLKPPPPLHHETRAWRSSLLPKHISTPQRIFLTAILSARPDPVFPFD